MGAADGIAEKMFYFMRVKNISKGELIEKVNVSKSTIYNILNGDITPDIQTLEEICKVLGVSIGKFLDMDLSSKVDYSVNLDNRTTLYEIIDDCSDAQVDKITSYARYIRACE